MKNRGRVITNLLAIYILLNICLISGISYSSKVDSADKRAIISSSGLGSNMDMNDLDLSEINVSDIFIKRTVSIRTGTKCISMTWSPDSKYIICDTRSSNQKCYGNAILINVVNTKQVIVINGGYCWRPIWSPSSRYFAYVDFEGRITIAELDDSREQVLKRTIIGNVVSDIKDPELIWDDESNKIYFRHHGTEGYAGYCQIPLSISKKFTVRHVSKPTLEGSNVLAEVGGVNIIIGRNARRIEGSFGNRIIYNMIDSQNYRVTRSIECNYDGTRKLLRIGKQQSYGSYETPLSPDGRWYLNQIVDEMTGDNAQLSIESISDRRSSKILGFKGYNLNGTAWSPNGRYIGIPGRIGDVSIIELFVKGRKTTHL